MRKISRLAASALLAALLVPTLQGCFPVVATGVAVGVMSVHDRRMTGVQTDDETREWKAAASVPPQYKEAAHVNFTAYNGRLLITGEVPSEEAKSQIGERAGKVNGVHMVFNETVVGPASNYTARSNDAYLTSKIKARLVDAGRVSANHVKVVTERGVAHLMGIVNEREAKAAIQTARTTDGVQKVINLFEVVSEEETRRIDSALAGSGGGRKPAPATPAPVEQR